MATQIARGRATVRPVPPSRAPRWLNILQVAVTILVAAAVAGSAVLSSRADGAWHEASRHETKWSAALIEDVRHVYGDEAPVALTVAAGEARARALRSAGGTLAAWEATTEEQTAERLRQAHHGTGSIVVGTRYRLRDGGYDLARRLADTRAAHPALRDLNPARAMAQGDAARRQARAIALATIPLVTIFVLLHAVVRLHGARQVGRGTHAVGDVQDVGLIFTPDDRTRQPYGALALLAWILMTTLPAGIIVADAHEQRALSLAAQHATRVSTAITANNLVHGFRSEGARNLAVAGLRGVAREQASLDTGDRWTAEEQIAVARADQRALPALRRMIDTMTKPPTAGVDLRTGRVIAATPRQWDVLVAAQNLSVRTAERAGNSSDILQYAVFLAALVQSMALMSAVAPMRGPAPTQRMGGQPGSDSWPAGWVR